MARTFALLCASLMLLAASACGQSEGEKRAEEDRRTAAAAKASQEAEDEERGETAGLCQELITPFRDSLTEMGSRISVGLVPADYTEQLGNMRVAYDRTEWDSTPNAYCLEEVGVPLESAFNEYVKAGEIWDDCIEDYNCDVERDKLSKMQKRWTKAAELVEKSDAALADFKLDSEAE